MDKIHKAVGLMLRKVGKKHLDVEITFLDKYAVQIPRTMLRYAIENFPYDLRREYLRPSIIVEDEMRVLMNNSVLLIECYL